jgi:UDP-glucose:(heptosyl)LPS alpha-1,3-glucosyltransferase
VPSPQGITVHELGGPRTPNALRHLRHAWRTGAAVRSGRYDVVHAHADIVGADVLTAQSCHRSAMRVLRSEGIPAGGWGLTDRVRLALERANMQGRRYGKVIAVSSGVRDELASEYGVPADDVRVIPNGVHPAEFATDRLAALRSETRDRLGIPAGALLLLTVANEFRRKGVDIVIRALATVPTMDLRYVVVGDDDPRECDALARQLGVRDRVLFAGQAREVTPFYAAADIFVLPTAYEAFSLALIEGAAAGLPLLVTRVHGASDVLVEGVNGLFVLRAPADLAHSLSLLADPGLRQTMGEESRLRSAAFSWESIADRVLEVYDEVLQAKHARRNAPVQG